MKLALIVDDDPIALELHRALLAALEIAVVASAFSGKDAMEALARHPEIDHLVTDLIMPDCDGIELLTHLDQIRCSAGLIIVTSAIGSVKKGAAELCIAYGLNLLAVLDKPLRKDALEEALRNR